MFVMEAARSVKTLQVEVEMRLVIIIAWAAGIHTVMRFSIEFEGLM